jgi:bifunctional non-homologous end joining protein LigD
MPSAKNAAPFPTSIKPMLCTLIREPFNDPSYLYEIKWDGYRAIAFVKDGNARLDSRGGLNFTKKYPSIVRALNELGEDIVIDGEVVFLNESGKPDFDALQKVNGQKANVIFYAFDLLWYRDKNHMPLPLIERKKILRDVLEGNNVIRYSDDFDDGVLLFSKAEELGLEGIIAKQRNSPYLPDDRSRKWLKIPTVNRQEFVIGGWVESESGRPFRTLLFGSYHGDTLQWVGHAGGGYKESEMPSILKKLKSLEVDKSPFANQVEYDGIAHWTKPVLVANIQYATLTKGGKIRKPAIFLGFRNDKKPTDVKNELPVKLEQQKPASKKTVARSAATADSNWPAVENQKIHSTDVLTFDDCSVEIHNANRQIWKGISKGHLIQYYHDISKYILPHISNRPLSLYLKLNGPNAPGLYIKDMEGRQPDCADIFTAERKHKKAGKRDQIDYLVCNNEPTLLYMIDIGCIDVNPWTSTIEHPNNPDYIVIDLDPSDKDFSKAIETAIAAEEVLKKSRLTSFVKTSGKTGIHIFVPCVNFNYSQARIIAGHICNNIHSLVPAISTTEVDIKSRGDKLYVDPNQNDYSDSVAAVYSVRPNKIPTVSTPLSWKEVKPSLDPSDFTIDSIMKRLEKKGDLFSGVLDKKIATKNSSVLKKLLG